MTDTHAAREGAFNAAVLAATLIGEHAADTVEILNKLPPSDAADVVRLLPRDFAIEILDKPELDFGTEIIEALPRHVAAPLLAGMVRRHGGGHRAAARGACKDGVAGRTR